MFKFPSYRRIKLAAIHYKHINNADQLCGIQFEFTGGVRGAMLETSLAKETQIKTIKIDPKSEIRSVSMKVWNGYALVGLRLTDGEGKHIVDLNWAGVGQWQSQEIPEDHEIIGMKCNIAKHPSAIPRVGILVWKPRITDENENMCRLSW